MPRHRQVPGKLTGDLALYLKKDPYEETHPKMPALVNHFELTSLTETTRGRLIDPHTAAFHSSLRSGPLVRGGGRQLGGNDTLTKPWTQSFNSRGDSFSMLRDSYHPVEVAKEEKRDHNRNKHRDAITPNDVSLLELGRTQRAPRNRVDPHRGRRFNDEAYVSKIHPNAQTFRCFREAAAHPDECRFMLSLRQ